MRKNKLFVLLLIIPMLFCGVGTAYAGSPNEVYTVARVQSLCDGIVAYNGASSAQDLIDGQLCEGAGTTAEFYVIALSQSGSYRFDRYESALLSYLDTHEVYAATSREKYALTLAAIGSTDRYISDAADEAIGGLGVMSLVFGLHLLNNGYDSALYSTDGLISEILSCQKDDGGWAVMGSYGDADVTAMTLQALAPYVGVRGDVTDSVDRALDRLSDMQLDSGGFRTMGAENCESAAQVIIALSALGIDAQTDDRFIKNGSSVMNAMMGYDTGWGFAHTGSTPNDNATLEAFCALTAYLRYCYGQGSLYLLDHVDHSAPADNDNGSQNNGSNGSDTPNRSNQSNSAGNTSSGRSDNGSGSASDNNRNEDSDTAGRAETDPDGNRIIVINGQRYIEATTASGEMMTINVAETEAPVNVTVSPTVKPTYGGFQPSATADMRAASDENGSSGGYKGYAILGVILAAGAACAVLFLLKKRGKKHYIAVAILAAAGILFILLTDFRSADGFQKPVKTDGDLQVTISIRCDTIVGREKVNRLVPDDGVILAPTTYTAAEGDTVFDVLIQAIRDKKIPMDNRGAKGAAYIAGINALYEFDYGELSGWMYRVNGVFPDVGCESYTVSDGDEIEWLYTTEIGKDL